MYQLASVAVLVVAAFHSSPVNGLEDDECKIPTQPCRIKLTNHGVVHDMIVCRCPGEDHCDDTWEDPDRVLSLKVASINSFVYPLVKLCKSQMPTKVCTPEDSYAFKVKGPLFQPREIVDQKCRCQPGDSMIVVSRETSNSHIYHAFMCQGVMRECMHGMGTSCAEVKFGSTYYTCKCRDGLSCRGGRCNKFLAAV